MGYPNPLEIRAKNCQRESHWKAIELKFLVFKRLVLKIWRNIHQQFDGTAAHTNNKKSSIFSN